MHHRSTIASICALACVNASAFGLTSLPLKNAGFEDGMTGWEVKRGDANALTVGPDAASLGKRGLRFGDGKTQTATTASTAAFDVTPGHLYRADYWGKKVNTDGEGVSVKLEFYDAAGKPLEPLRAPRGWAAGGPKYTGGFEQNTLQAVAPDDAKTVAIVISGKAPAVAYLDDFSLYDMGEPTAELVGTSEPPVEMDALLADIKADPHRGKPPTKIVIKVDDFSAVKDQDAVPARWLKFASFIESRKVRANIGIVMVSFEKDLPTLCQWVKDKHAGGLFEFWFHGYDHASHVVDGKLATEFAFREYDDQKQRFNRSQELATQRFGFAFQTFGPPGQGRTPLDAPPKAQPAIMGQPIGDVTFKVLDEDSDMKVVLYPAPIEEVAQAAIARGKLTVLRRVWAVNFENPTFNANYAKFVEGYAHNRGQDYFVLQGHPMQWDDQRFENFTQIIDFLIEQQAEFVTPESLIGTK